MSDRPTRILIGAFYAIFVVLAAFSPLFGAVIGALFGLPFGFRSAIAFMWVGVCSSLPASLGVAKAFGTHELEAYWVYLQSFRNSSRRRIIASWIAASVVFLLLGAASLFAS